MEEEHLNIVYKYKKQVTTTYLWPVIIVVVYINIYNLISNVYETVCWAVMFKF